MKKYITNEDYREGSRCPRLFWLDKENKAEYHGVNKQLSETAREYIHGGKEVVEGAPEEMAEETAYLISRGAKTVKNPVFITGNICLRAEVITIDKYV